MIVRIYEQSYFDLYSFMASVLCVNILNPNSYYVWVVQTHLTQKIVHSAHVVYLCVFLWIGEKTTIISRYNVKWLVLIIERDCVYCATEIIP
jgi:hypothetical protein